MTKLVAVTRQRKTFKTWKNWPVAQLGGLGIINPCDASAFQFAASQRVTGPLVSLILEQDSQFTVDVLNEQLA